MTDTPLSIPEYHEHGHIIITPHQVLDQVVNNTQRLADQANHNALLTDETLCLCNETQELCAQLDHCPSQSAFAELQAQVAALTTGMQNAQAPVLKVHQPHELKGLRKDIQEFMAHCELNFAAAPGLFLTDDRMIVFIASLLTGIAFKWYQALEGDLFTRSYPAFRHEFLSAFDEGDLRSRSVAVLCKLEQTGSVAEYTTNFEVHLVHTGYNNVVLCDTFYFGLKDKIKDLLTEAGCPTNLAHLKADALKFNHRVMEQQREQPAIHTTSPVPSPKPSAIEVDPPSKEEPTRTSHTRREGTS
jgi:hypothetical protein